MSPYLTVPTDQITATILSKLRPTSHFLTFDTAVKTLATRYDITTDTATRTLIRVLAELDSPLRMVISDLGVLCNLARPRNPLDLATASKYSWYELVNGEDTPAWPELVAVRAEVYISPGGQYLSHHDHEHGSPDRHQAATTGGLRHWIVATTTLADLIARSVAEKKHQLAAFADRHGATVTKLGALLIASGMTAEEVPRYLTVDPATRSITLTITEDAVLDEFGDYLGRLDLDIL